ncbi:hypothetical protein [Pseudoalteromonas sp. AC163]|uniref:hypothetical protein n=1 Tax=Pseudoalteromonas sp. AC163 TaxID=1055790 RepID=UPI0003FEE08C|nr:hypothetical protein [Pseudoalteromonas sp. AC163]
MIKIQTIGKEDFLCYSIDELSQAIKKVAGCHASFKYRQRSGLSRVLYMTVTAGGVIQDTYTKKVFEIEELWRLHLI